MAKKQEEGDEMLTVQNDPVEKTDEDKVPDDDYVVPTASVPIDHPAAVDVVYLKAAIRALVHTALTPEGASSFAESFPRLFE